MSKVSILSWRLDLNEAGVTKRIRKLADKTQLALAQEVLEDDTPFVPYWTGQTSNSGQATEDGVSWETDYVREIYFSSREFGKTVHPLATSQWHEKSAAVNLDKWVEHAQKNMKG